MYFSWHHLYSAMTENKEVISVGFWEGKQTNSALWFWQFMLHYVLIHTDHHYRMHNTVCNRCVMWPPIWLYLNKVRQRKSMLHLLEFIYRVIFCLSYNWYCNSPIKRYAWNSAWDLLNRWGKKFGIPPKKVWFTRLSGKI